MFMPGRNFQHGGDPKFFGRSERMEGIARPAVEQIIVAAPQIPRRDSVDHFLFGIVIVFALEIRKKPDRMPLEGGNFSGVEIRSPIAKSNGQTEFPLDPSKRFVCDRVKADATDPRGSGIQDAGGQSLINVSHGFND
jgi:hypothetical protein